MNQDAALTSLITGAGTLVLGEYEYHLVSSYVRGLLLKCYRSELAHWWKLSRNLDEYHLPVRQTPV